MTYTVGTLFSGIGVPDLCARLLGMATVWQVEKEAFPQAVLRKNFPEAELHGDIFDCHDLPYVDLIVAGFPCQPFSVAGQRQGERDPRYLVPEMLRVIDEVRPRVVLLENVPGFASLDDGQSFKRLLGALAEMGLDAEWGHIRASDVGAPHQRERWWLVGYTESNRDRRERICMADTQGKARQPNVWREPDSYDEVVVNAGGARCEGYSRAVGMGTELAGADDTGLELADAASVRQGKLQGGDETRQPSTIDTSPALGVAQRSGRSRDARRWADAQPADGYAWDGRETQPGLGRVLDGLASGVDGFRPYPARPGQPQHAFEPPRVTSRNDSRAKRLKALGNSMAVDVVFEVMLAIRTWLETENAHG